MMINESSFMFRWLNGQSYIAIAAIVTLMFSGGMFIGLLLTGEPVSVAAAVAGPLSILCMAGFGLASVLYKGDNQ